MKEKIRHTLVKVRDAVTQPWRNFLMSYPIWFYVLNHEGRAKLAAKPPTRSHVEERVARDLAENGIAFTSLTELFPNEDWLAKLQAHAESLRPFAEQKTTKKPFILEHWEAIPQFSLENPFVALSLTSPVLTIVNSYMKMWSKFYYFMLGRAVPIGDEAKASQRWHRDFEEVKMCKMFVYLNDVGEGAGPFMYVPKSNLGGKWRNVFPQRPGQGYYPPDGAVEKIIPGNERIVCLGKAGTVIFADTSGLHKGGFAKDAERLMFTAGFSSAAAFGNRRYHLPKDSELASLSPEARFALRGIPHA